MATVKLRGEGNCVWQFDLPLSEVYADQVRARKLVPVDDRSAEAVADLLLVETGEDPEPQNEQVPEVLVEDDPDAKMPALLERAAEVGLDEASLVELRKPGMSKVRVVEAIKAKLAGNGE